MDKRELLERAKEMTAEERKFAVRALPTHWPEIREAMFYDEHEITDSAAISLQRLLDGWFVEEVVDGEDVQQAFTHVVMRPPKANGDPLPLGARAPSPFKPLAGGHVTGGTVFTPQLVSLAESLTKEERDRLSRSNPYPPVIAPPKNPATEKFWRANKIIRDCKNLGLSPPDRNDPEFEAKALALMEAKRSADAKSEVFVQPRKERKVSVMTPPPSVVSGQSNG